MRIWHVYHRLSGFGGAEEHLTTLAIAQAAQGHDVRVCLVQAGEAANQYVQRLRAAGVRRCQLPVGLSRLVGDWETTERALRAIVGAARPLTMAGSLPLAALRHVSPAEARASIEGRIRSLSRRLLAREPGLFTRRIAWQRTWARPDVLHLHGYGGTLDFVMDWATRHGLPLLYQEHSTPDATPRQWYDIPGRLDGATIVLAVSEPSAEALRRVCGVVRPIRVVPPLASDAAAGGDGGNEPSDPPGRVCRVVTVARLSSEKGLEFLVDAAARLRGADAGVAFDVHGEGYLREALQARIDRAGLRSCVTLHGAFQRRDLRQILGRADVFVLPSLTEGYPLSVVEAMACGLPIVATRVGGVPDLIEDGANGLLCEPSDPGALAACVLTLLRQPDRRRALGGAAREYYAAHLAPTILSARYLGAYEEAIQMTRQAASG
jgi:glycosyltransferase involved in cell wall biosynthesis